MKTLTDKQIVKLIFYDFEAFRNLNLSEQKMRSLSDLLGMNMVVDIYTGQIKNECRHCKKRVLEEDFDIAIGYWYPNCWYICHKECVKEQRVGEAYECQKLDRNCNDCAFMVRDKVRQEKWNPNPGGINKILYGKCTNYDKDISFIANTSSICDGFAHRKDIKLI